MIERVRKLRMELDSEFGLERMPSHKLSTPGNNNILGKDAKAF